MGKKTIKVEVRCLSESGREKFFILTRIVDKELSKEEIVYKFIGNDFNHTYYNSEINLTITEKFKVVDILSYDFLHLKLYLTPRSNSKGQVFANFLMSNLNGKEFINPQSNENIKFTPNSDEGLVFQKKGFSSDKENYVINDEYGKWIFPRECWELHHKPFIGNEYIDFQEYLESEILNHNVVEKDDWELKYDYDLPPQRKEFKTEEEYLKSLNEWEDYMSN